MRWESRKESRNGESEDVERGGGFLGSQEIPMTLKP